MELTREELRKNIALRYLDILVYKIGLGIVPLITTLNFFLSSIVTSKILIGIFVAFANAALHISQVFIGKKIREDINTDRNYIIFLCIRTILYVLIAASIWFVSDYTKMVIIFYVLYILAQFVRGICMIYNITLIADIIPKKFLGKYYGYSSLFGNIGEVLGALLIAYMIVNPFDFPKNYAFLFLIMSICSMIGAILMWNMKYVVDRDKEKHIRTTYLQYFKEMTTIFTHDKEFLKFNLSDIFAGLGTGLYVFLILYAKESIGISVEELAVINIIMFCGQSIFSIIWGYINTYYPWEFTYVICRILYIINYLLLLLYPTKLCIYIVYFLYGISVSGFVATQNKAMIDMGGEQKTIYTAIYQLVITPTLIISSLFISGLIDLIGYEKSIIVSLIFIICAVIIPLMPVKKNNYEN